MITSGKEKRLVIFGRGQFPISSAALRMRMWAKGLRANGIETDIIIAYPAPSERDKKESKENEHFILPVQNGKSNALKNIYQKLYGTYKAYKLLNQHFKNIDAVLLYGLGYLEGILVYKFCKKNKIKYFAERCDENRQLYANRKISFSERIALYNDLWFDKYIVNKLDAYFVVSSYLEKKYQDKKYSGLNIKRSIPVYVDIEEFNKLSAVDIDDIAEVDTSVFKSDKIKIFFAGSCNHTNGLFFFLKCAAKIKKRDNLDFSIILIFHSGDVGKVKNYCENLDIAEVVTILPKLPYRFIPALYKKVDILVLPEMGDVVANAGFPGKTGEYLASGKAIISTNFSDLRNYLHNGYNAMISQIGDEEKYMDNLKLLINDDELRKMIGRNAVETSKHYFDYKFSVNSLIEELNI